ncbi:increased DNA methylation 3 [Gossypium australe]|uniref:Increased DNA methylation 3 n=1 Tax=Gossypium australe TaxID=47621 RepID=A0A5B6VDR6_9ROSI|nr:increased DNA methylation 3 [Gossypium australe]
MGVQDYAESKLKPSVDLTGSAKECSNGPSIGVIDIGVSQSAFLFRVALPGIRSDQSKLKCEIQRDGKVLIQGIVTQGSEVLQGLSSVCQMTVEKLCSPGPFTISFNLPGPVDPRLFSPKFRPDGILEVVVMRYRRPSDPVDAWAPLS